jgi:hypothetical protein
VIGSVGAVDNGDNALTAWIASRFASRDRWTKRGRDRWARCARLGTADRSAEECTFVHARVDNSTTGFSAAAPQVARSRATIMVGSVRCFRSSMCIRRSIAASEACARQCCNQPARACDRTSAGVTSGNVSTAAATEHRERLETHTQRRLCGTLELSKDSGGAGMRFVPGTRHRCDDRVDDPTIIERIAEHPARRSTGPRRDQGEGATSP